MLALRSLGPGRALDRRDLGRPSFGSNGDLGRPSFGSNGFRARQLGGVVVVAQPLYTGTALAADAGVAFEDALGELPQHRRPIRIMYLEARQAQLRLKANYSLIGSFKFVPKRP